MAIFYFSFNQKFADSRFVWILDFKEMPNLEDMFFINLLFKRVDLYMMDMSFYGQDRRYLVWNVRLSTSQSMLNLIFFQISWISLTENDREDFSIWNKISKKYTNFRRIWCGVTQKKLWSKLNETWIREWKLSPTRSTFFQVFFRFFACFGLPNFRRLFPSFSKICVSKIVWFEVCVNFSQNVSYNADKARHVF